MAPALLAACGGGDSTTTGATEIGGSVGYLGYQGEDYPKVLEKFKQENGITFAPSYTATPADVMAKLAGGAGAEVDAVAFSAGGTQTLLESGIELQPLDIERIPNWKNIERFIDYTGSEAYSSEGDIVGAPLAWGGLGITYDSAAIPEPKAWADLQDPSFKGKITTLDDYNTNYGLTAKILGIDLTRMTQDGLDQCNEYLLGILRNCRTLSPAYGDMAAVFGSGEIVAAYAGWSAINVFALGAGSKTIKTNTEPEEGSAAFVEAYGIAPEADNVDTVYAIINELLDKKINAEASASILAAPTVDGAQRLQPPQVVSLYPPESRFEQYWEMNSIARDAPVESDEFVTIAELTESWTQLKAEI